MAYTIAEAVRKTGLTAYTLRYYEKEGLLPFIHRTQNGVRKYEKSDFEWLSLITCLKNSGMPIKKIKTFVDLCRMGDSTLEERLKIVISHKRAVQEKMNELEKHMDKIDHKIWYYTKAVEAGTEDIHKKM